MDKKRVKIKKNEEEEDEEAEEEEEEEQFFLYIQTPDQPSPRRPLC